MQRTLGIMSYPCKICGKKFREKSQLELHLRLHVVQDPAVQDGHLALLRFKSAFQKLQAATLSATRADTCSKEGTRLNMETNKTQDKQIKSGNTDQADVMTESGDGSNIEVAENKKGKVSAERKEDNILQNLRKMFPLLSNRLQNIQSYPCHICSKKFGELSCFELHLRNHMNENPRHQDGHLGMLRLRSALLKFYEMVRSSAKGPDSPTVTMLEENSDENVEENNVEMIEEKDEEGEVDEEEGANRKDLWYTCEFCGECFTSTEERATHRDGHTERSVTYSKAPVDAIFSHSLHGCDKCNKKYASRRMFRRHMHAEHPEAYTCQQCGRHFDTEYVLEKHIKSHDYPFTCHKCGKRFRFKGGLSNHLIQAHTDKRPFACSTCGNTFKSVNRLQVHIRLVHEAEKKVCEVCGKTFTRKATLDIHKRTVHTRERPFLCQICGKGFHSYKTLKVHKATHGAPLYECHICHKRITTKFGLTCHVRIHTGEEPFCCDFCGKTFKRKHGLDTHVKSQHLSQV